MDRFLTFLFKTFALLVLKLPAGLRWGLAKSLGRFARFLLKGRARLTLENLRAAGYGPQEAERISARAWEALGLVGAEFIYYLMGSPERLAETVSWEGAQYLEEALAKGKGAIIASAHLGNWELLGASLAQRYPVTAIARDQENRDFNRIIAGTRCKFARMVPMNASMKPILSALRRNELAYFIADQRGRGVKCRFMEREAEFFIGAATFALRTGAVLLPARLVRVRPEKYRLIIDPPVEPVQTGDLDQDARETTARMIKVFEQQIRENPEQWLWMHKLWPSDIKV